MAILLSLVNHASIVEPRVAGSTGCPKDDTVNYAAPGLFTIALSSSGMVKRRNL